MSGYTTNLSNLPPGVSSADIDRHFGERAHREQCPQHDGWKPDRDTLMDVAYELVNTWDEERLPPQSAIREQRIERAVDDLRRVIEPMCICDQLASAYAEDAAERAGDEKRGD